MRPLRSPGGRLSLLLAFGTAAVALGQGAAAPVLPEYTLRFGVGAIGLAAAVAMYAIGRLIITIPTGIVAHRLSSRLVLTTGCAVTAIGVVGTGLAPNFPTLLVFRTLGGVGSGIYMTSAIVAIVALSPVGRRTTRIGFNQSALLASVTVGPALGGILGETTGLRASFVIVGAISVLCAVLMWVALPWAMRDPGTDRHRPGADGSHGTDSTDGLDGATASPTDEPVAGAGRTARAARPDRILWSAFVTACAINLAVFATRQGARQTILPLIAVQDFGLSVGAMGALFTMMSIVSLAVLPAASWAGDHFGRIPTILPGLLATAGGLGLCALAGSLPVLWVGAGIMAAGMSLAGPAPMAWAADASPESRHGVTLAVFRTAGDAGSFVGPIALAGVATATTLGGSLIANGLALAALAAVALVTGVRWRRR